MIVISVRTDLDRLAATVSDLARRELPFATARALTSVAYDVEADLRERHLPSVFADPVSFTAKAFRVIPAAKSKPVAQVLLKDEQQRAGYPDLLALEEHGGARSPKRPRFGGGKGLALVRPVGTRVNRHGNIPFRGLARAKAQRSVFVGTVKGVGGFWRRKGKSGLTLLAAFDKAASYRPRLGFWRRVGAQVPAGFERHIGPALERAIRTSKAR